MRKLVFTLGLLLLLGSVSFAQEGPSFKVTKVKKAAYFDVSEPLRDKEPIKPSERDRSWKDDIIQNEFIPPQEKDNRDIEDPVVQKDKGSREMRGPINNFEGTGNLNGVYPPDTEGDVGEDYYFQMINLSFTIYDKEGNTVYGPADNSTLWDGFIGPWTGSNDGDPIVVYDEEAERWVASQFAVETSNGQYYELVAVSQTSDPTGEYYRYAFEYDNFNDYPKLGVWPDAYVATYNMFIGNSFQGAGVAAFDREAMLAGEEDAEQQFFQLSGEYYGVLPADFDGPAPPDSIPHYVVHNSNDPREIQIFEFTIDWEEPTNSDITLEHSLEPESYTTASTNVPQPNTSTALDDFIGQMMYPLKFRKFDDHLSMVMNHAVVTSFQAEHGIRWYEVRNTDGEWNIHQQSTYAPDDGLHRWLGSIAMNGNGDIALGFSVSGEEEVYPSVRYVARTSGGTLGEMNTEEIEVVAGTSSQTGIERWGDYAAMSVDPSDDSTFWFTSEYITGPWKTRIVSFDLEEPQEPVVYAGPDTTICEDNSYNTEAASSQYTSDHLWETSGDGDFLPNNEELVVNYLRGSQDIENGGAELSLTGYGYDEGQQDQDTMYLTIVSNPQVETGNDTTICNTSTYSTDPEVNSALMVQWATSGDGEFENPTQQNTVYYPGSGDLDNGEVTLTLSATPQSPCTESASDDVTITFDVCTDVESISAQSDALTINPNPNQGKFTMVLDSKLSGKAKITVRNTSGNEVFRKTLSKQVNKLRENIDLSNLPDGVYFLRLQLKNKAFADKIIIR
ncbi:MAG: T9SS type A sorting domain-containing protein [Bacteroidales bacterium]|nr:T9SS type A sorting domain-containing protein [Bacteroidales bacterium]MCF8336834.1 T9SS type A sorting domain-containing protein [Bacteroidales bacterium]